jgi:acyl carrier protein
MSNSTEVRLYALFADVFGVDPAGLSADDTNLTVPGWDSVQHIQLLLALEESFGVVFEPEEFAALTSVRALLERLGAGDR